MRLISICCSACQLGKALLSRRIRSLRCRSDHLDSLRDYYESHGFDRLRLDQTNGRCGFGRHQLVPPRRPNAYGWVGTFSPGFGDLSGISAWVVPANHTQPGSISESPNVRGVTFFEARLPMHEFGVASFPLARGTSARGRKLAAPRGCRFVTKVTVRSSPTNLSGRRFGKHALNTIARTDPA